MLSFYDCDKNLSEIDFNDVEKKLPKNLIPFAFDWGGNYLCLEKKQLANYLLCKGRME